MASFGRERGRDAFYLWRPVCISLQPTSHPVSKAPLESLFESLQVLSPSLLRRRAHFICINWIGVALMELPLGF